MRVPRTLASDSCSKKIVFYSVGKKKFWEHSYIYCEILSLKPAWGGVVFLLLTLMLMIGHAVSKLYFYDSRGFEDRNYRSFNPLPFIKHLSHSTSIYQVFTILDIFTLCILLKMEKLEWSIHSCLTS